MRPSRDEVFIVMSYLMSSRGTCLRRKVGCVLVNQRGHVLSTGYNGVAAGMPHCNDELTVYPENWRENTKITHPHACSGAHAASGTGLDGCEALHAEQNALLQCKNVWEIDTCYCTASPCITCVKLLLNSSCKRVVFGEEYPHSRAKELWEMSRGKDTWVQSDLDVSQFTGM